MSEKDFLIGPEESGKRLIDPSIYRRKEDKKELSLEERKQKWEKIIKEIENLPEELSKEPFPDLPIYLGKKIKMPPPKGPIFHYLD